MIVIWILSGLFLLLYVTGGLAFYLFPVIALYVAWTMGRYRRDIMGPRRPKPLPAPQQKYPNLPDLRTVYYTEVDPF